jgi:ribose transport system substrate-binding protein
MTSGIGSSQAAEPVSIDVGGGYVIHTDGKPLKIAFFALSSTDSFLKAQNARARATADKLGVSMDIFSANWDASKQMDQMQIALASKRYNAWILEAVDGNIACQIATKQAPAANILVQTLDNTVCGRIYGEGDELWSPGTLNYVGGNESVAAWTTLWKKAIADNPGPQTVGVLIGPQLNTITKAFLRSMKNTVPSDWKIITPVYTNYSVPDAEAKAIPLLQSHPDMTILMSAYTNITKGAVSAMRINNRVGKVKIYEGGGTSTGLGYIKTGITEVMMARYSQTPIVYSINAVVDAWAGKTIPHFTGDDGHALEEGRDPNSAAFLVTKANADKYHPEND